MLLIVKTQNIINDLKNSEDIFNFLYPDQNHELFGNKNKKVIGKFNLETTKNIWIDELVCIILEASSFRCKDKIESKKNQRNF